MERRVHLPREAQRAQAAVPGVRRKSLHARRLPRNGGTHAHQFAKGTGRARDSAQELPASAAQVSGVG